MRSQNSPLIVVLQDNPTTGGNVATIVLSMTHLSPRDIGLQDNIILAGITDPRDREDLRQLALARTVEELLVHFPTLGYFERYALESTELVTVRQS